jgi:hypothetical protein
MKASMEKPRTWIRAGPGKGVLCVGGDGTWEGRKSRLLNWHNDGDRQYIVAFLTACLAHGFITQPVKKRLQTVPKVSSRTTSKTFFFFTFFIIFLNYSQRNREVINAKRRELHLRKRREEADTSTEGQEPSRYVIHL